MNLNKYEMLINIIKYTNFLFISFLLILSAFDITTPKNILFWNHGAGNNNYIPVYLFLLTVQIILSVIFIFKYRMKKLIDLLLYLGIALLLITSFNLSRLTNCIGRTYGIKYYLISDNIWYNLSSFLNKIFFFIEGYDYKNYILDSFYGIEIIYFTGLLFIIAYFILKIKLKKLSMK